MFKFATPVILIGVSIGVFLMFTSPFYKEVNSLRSEVTAYNEALNNAKALEAERDKLTQKYSSISPANLEKLQKLLPDSVSNIRLILEIEKLAAPYGMVLKDVTYDALKPEAEMEANGITNNTKTNNNNNDTLSNKEYKAWDLGFSVQGNYYNFLNFVRSLEKNLRIVDMNSIEFSSESEGGLSPTSSNNYKYNFKIKTYWLKN